MATIKKLKPGQTCYTVTRHKMGNTTLSTTAVHPVFVLEVHDDHVIARWNNNAPRKYHEGDVAKWKVNKPVTVTNPMGVTRLATRDEKAKLKAKPA